MSDISAQIRPATIAPAAAIEAELRDELTHADAMVGTIAPILRHLLANGEHSLFSDEIIASMRGMMADIARQLLEELDGGPNGAGRVDADQARVRILVDQFATQQGFLAHTHALAIEWQLTQRLQARLALDPVLSPLLQALIASSEPPVAATAMALMAAQARFAQTQRRMQLPLAELPGDLLHAALIALRAEAGEDDEAQAAEAEQRIRAAYNEGRTRLGLISRLVMGMGGGAMAALSISHAGTAIFISALALASGQDRDLAALATNESQVSRLALALAAAGVKASAIEEQFAAIHPDVTMPEGFEQLGADRAAALLARSVAVAGG